MSYIPLAKDSDYDPDVEGLFYVAWKMEDVAVCMAENGYLSEESVYACLFWDYGEDEKVDEVCDCLERNETIDNLYDSEKINRQITDIVDRMCDSKGFKRVREPEKRIAFSHATGGRYIGSVEWFEDDIWEIIEALGYDTKPDISNIDDFIVRISDKIYDVLTDDDINDEIASAIVSVCEKLNVEKIQG